MLRVDTPSISADFYDFSGIAEWRHTRQRYRGLPTAALQCLSRPCFFGIIIKDKDIEITELDTIVAYIAPAV